MAAINYADKYQQEMVSAYRYISRFAELYGSDVSIKAKFSGGKIVYVPIVKTSGATATNRDSISLASRKYDVSWEPMTMTMDRNYKTLVDPMDKDETNEVITIANVTKTFNETQKIPEMDAYAASTLAGFATAAGNTTATAITADNVLTLWDDALAAMGEADVPDTGLIAYVTPTTYKAIKQAAQVNRNLTLNESDDPTRANRKIMWLDEVKIVQVPTKYMKTEYDFTEGFVAAEDAGTIDLLLVQPQSVIAPVKYEESRIDVPNAMSEGKEVYFERYYYDVFALTERRAGIYANITAVTP